MHVVFATDGSEQAEVAGQLICSVRWPPESVIRVVTAVDAGSVFFGAPLAPAVPANADLLEEDLVDEAENVLDAATRQIACTGATVERSLVRQRAATAIVEEASEWGADLLVIGSRGHGQIASMVLGSVSAEVVDHAPCPVLVARRPQLRKVILAHDGSEFAMHGEALLTRWPIFADVDVEVITVAPGSAPWAAGLAPTMYAGSMDPYRDSLVATLIADAGLGEASARRLSNAGLRATSSVVEGAAATELIAVANERDADLIVIGTRGRTGLRRLLLGSVARNVMAHAHCSVLIVR